MVEDFHETLSIPLHQNIMSLSTLPTDLDGCYEWAIKLQNNFLCMKSAILKIQNWEDNTTSNTILTRVRRTQFPWMLTSWPPKKELRTAFMKKRDMLYRKDNWTPFYFLEIVQTRRWLLNLHQTSLKRLKGMELYTHFWFLAGSNWRRQGWFFTDTAEEGF